MSIARDVRKQFSLFVDGRGYAGQVESLTPPKLVSKVEEFRAGGMPAPVSISMGMEKLEASFQLLSFDADLLSLFGIRAGNATRFIVREALESFDGTVKTVVHTIGGRVRELDQGERTAGGKTNVTVMVDVVYYKLEHGSRTVQEIDLENSVHIVDGVDVLRDMRTALGL